MVSICLERGWLFHGPTWSIPRHVTGLFNNGCLFMTVNFGGERGGWLPTPLSSYTPKEDGNQVREGKVTIDCDETSIEIQIFIFDDSIVIIIEKYFIF